ncbi:ABC transporter permease [Aestuariispira ectoiniformans]|uniref:ABC transporter permease n=1 Tax=Aestuariispira ectoiniformans TaxID=2775080 RepID=UPI00223AD9E2|nr:ABC transporter permease [Aestuariispira ectoiniformans]
MEEANSLSAFLDWGFLDWTLVFDNWPLYVEGVWNTINLTALCLVLGWILSIPLAFARANRHPIFNGPIWCFTYFFRGTPLLVQTYLIYYGLGQFDFVRDGLLWPLLKDAWWCALIAFTLNSCAYQTEILRGAIEATPFGEVEAAKACGMSPTKMKRRIILPGALRRALPMYSNEVIFMLHGSVIASTITIIDILGAGRVVNAKYYVAYEGFISAAVLYMILVFVISRVFKRLEQRLHAHLRPREA